MSIESDHAAHDLESIYCPSCGYDLRGSLQEQAARCPECGAQYDLATLSQSRVPWMHRTELGRLRAWWRTCWMVLVRPKDLAASLNAPMPYADARRFWVICSALVSVPGVIAAWWSPEVAGVGIPAVNIPGIVGAASPVLSWFSLNAYAPWVAGWYLRPVAMACAAIAVFLTTGAVSYLFHFAPIPRRLQDRAAAAGLYTSGAIVFGAIAALAVVLILALVLVATNSFQQPLLLALPFLVPFAVLAWGVAVLRTYRRICRASALRSIAAAALIIATTLLAPLFALVFIPWCVGFARILISAFDT